MLLSKGLIAAIALAQTATAFYPWFPNYRGTGDSTHVTAKRAPENDLKGRGFATTMKIEQRLPKNNLPHDVRVRQLADQLRRKYNRAGPRGRPVSVEERHVDKRATNTYRVVTAAEPKQTNSAAVHQDGTDFSYFAVVKIGSNETPMYMLLDTGAGTSWVMGRSCTSAPCTTHNQFGPEDSDTWKDSGNGFRISYGSGEVSGTIGTDTMSLAGLTISATFGIANTTSTQFSSFPIDGILGLSHAKGPNPTFLEDLVEAKLLKSNLFGISIARNSDGPNNGVINFGEIDTSLLSGDLTYNPVSSNNQGDWAIEMDDVAFGDEKAGIDDKLAYIDTGTSYIFAPPADVKKFHDTIPGSKVVDGDTTYTVPCTTTGDLTFTFGKNSYKVSAKDWVGPKSEGACTSNIYGHIVIEGAWLLGDTFLKNVYSVFDVDGNRIGFAPKAAGSASSSLDTASASPIGGPTTSLTSQSPSGTQSSSENSPTTTGTTSSVTQSNGSPTGSLSGSATASLSAADATTSSTITDNAPGLNGHQTSAPDSGTAVAASSTSPSATPSGESSAARLDNSFLSAFCALLGFLVLIT